MGIRGKEGMNKNYGNKRERVGIRRFDERNKWDLFIMVGEPGEPT